jgi:hypothetical protein
MMSQEKVQESITKVCNDVRDLLIAKNREYGNSALEPLNIFSRLSVEEQLCVRIDDKIKRIQTTRDLGEGTIVFKEDTVVDLMGYLVLWKVLKELEAPAPAPEEVNQEEESYGTFYLDEPFNHIAVTWSTTSEGVVVSKVYNDMTEIQLTLARLGDTLKKIIPEKLGVASVVYREDCSEAVNDGV